MFWMMQYDARKRGGVRGVMVDLVEIFERLNCSANTLFDKNTELLDTLP